MKRIIMVVVAVLVTATAGWFIRQSIRSRGPITVPVNPTISKQNPMEITSTAFGPNQPIPQKYSCDGDGVNPPLEFKNIPDGIKSLALIVDDPDAPMGTWTHWTLWNMNFTTTSIGENSVPPEVVQGKTSSGQNNYGAPCPPSGQHRYFFKLFALDTMLSIPTHSTVDELQKAMEGHIVDQAELMGTYGR
jgi:Raf kinase inhibitor-like YbhB/YbcL family protein